VLLESVEQESEALSDELSRRVLALVKVVPVSICRKSHLASMTSGT